MKRTIITLAAFIALGFSSFAQSPQGFGYQAVIRDHSSELLVKQSVGMRLQIRQYSSDGQVIYTEEFQPETNSNGLINIIVGKGKSMDDFSQIDWSSGPYFIETAFDISGGTDYETMGTSQLMSVPYALYAENCGSINAINKNAGGSRIEDADQDTKIDTEESSDEDKIRFRLGGQEEWIMHGNRLESTNSGQSIFIGSSAGRVDDHTDNWNVFIGNGTGAYNTTGEENTAVGGGAFTWNVDGVKNTALGYMALLYNKGSWNTAVGNRSQMYTSTGKYNTSIGFEALKDNTSGEQNTAIGSFALHANQTGYSNIALGHSSAEANKEGTWNTAIGDQALGSNQNGDANIAMGRAALFNLEGDNNIAIGFEAANNQTSGSNNIILGNHIGVPSITGSNQMNIGNIIFAKNLDDFGAYAGKGNLGIGTHASSSYKLRVRGDVQLEPENTTYNFIITDHLAEPTLVPSTNNFGFLGTAETRLYEEHISRLTVYSSFTNLSDRKIKENIRPMDGALEKLLQLEGKTYDLKRDFVMGNGELSLEKSAVLEAERKDKIGFIAQEVEEIFPELVHHNAENDLKSVDYIGLIPVLVESVKTLNDRVEEQQEIIDSLREKLNNN